MRHVMSLRALSLLAWAVAAGAAPAPATMQDCAALASDAERLACYDRLAGHAAVPAPAAKPGTATPAPAAPATAPALAPAAAAESAKSTFGLYEAEHPKPPPAASVPSMTARVLALGQDSRGRRTVALEGHQLWELDVDDPLLAVGDVVTIRRATFGSFLLTTPSKRVHRARRLH